MAYKLKSTGIAANCTMCIAVDPDTGTVKDFASAEVTADMVVAEAITNGIAAQEWNGVSRYYAPLSANNFIAFGDTKPRFECNVNGQQRTVVWIGEAGGNNVRAFGYGSTSYFASANLGGGGDSYPTKVGLGNTSPVTGGLVRPSAGQKVIFGFSFEHGSYCTAYVADHDDEAMTVISGLAAPTGTSATGTNNFDLEFVGRRNDSTAQQNDKIHAVLIFDTDLSEEQWDSLRDDWFGVLLEFDGPPPDETAPTLSNPTATATGQTSASGSVTTDEGNGTLYYLASANSTESAATVKGGDSQAVTGTGVQNVGVTGLTHSTGYYLHFVHVDAAENESDVASSSQFTTDAPPPPATKGVRIQLSAGAESLTGLSVRWWDDPTATGAPDYSVDNEATDGSRWLEIDLDSTTANDVDDLGYLLVFKAGANPDDDMVAAGRVPIVDISE